MACDVVVTNLLLQTYKCRGDALLKGLGNSSPWVAASPRQLEENIFLDRMLVDLNTVMLEA